MSPSGSGGSANRTPTFEAVPAYKRLQSLLASIKPLVDDVDTAQAAWFALIPAGLVNSTEWEAAKELARKTTIRVRVKQSWILRANRETNEAVRRDLYDDPQEKAEAEKVLAQARALLEVLRGKGF